jgi:chromosome segregation ATPase
MKQVQAVVSAVSEVLGDSFIEGSTRVTDIITTEQKTLVRENVFQGILSGNVTFNGSLEDHSAIQRYVNGMVDNHFRKSRLLNGGSTYTPSGEGTKRDPQLRELNRLLSTLEVGTDDHLKVQEHITARSAQLQQERAAKTAANSRASIDVSVLPSHLAELISSDS